MAYYFKKLRYICRIMHKCQFSGPDDTFCSFKRLPVEYFQLEEVRIGMCPKLRLVGAVNIKHFEKYFDKKIRIMISRDMDVEKIHVVHLDKQGWIDIVEERNMSGEERLKVEMKYDESCEGCGKFKRREGEYKFDWDNKLDELEDECGKCGTKYCCLECKEQDWEKKHKYFCGDVEVQENNPSSLCSIL